MQMKFGSLDGLPTILIVEDDGDMRGYLWSARERAWKDGYTREAFSEAAQMTPEAFSQAFPDAVGAIDQLPPSGG